jgi:GTP-binding protein
MFIDEVSFTAKAGHGGSGAVSFRREKFIPRGGPDGGDGGKGGDVIMVSKRNLASLIHLQGVSVYAANKGHKGMGSNMSGKDGEDILIEVPVGTVCKNVETDEIMFDFTDEAMRFVVAKGGRGGMGNANFKSSTNQAPRFAQSGEEGEEFDLLLELKLIADVGLVGFPNAGKSTLLASLTRAHPKIAAYPFTTLSPNLGVVYVDRMRQFVLADIPGLIEGAHEGVGLGIKFLKHVERTGLLLFIIDLCGEDLHLSYKTLLDELESFNPAMLEKERIIALNKSDVFQSDETKAKLDEFKSMLNSDEEVFVISGVAKQGLKELTEELYKRVKLS